MDENDRRLMALFEAISRIPRGSKNEEGITRWFEAWASGRGFRARRDASGNLLIAVPPAPGWERAPGVILQGHLDMVCEKTPASTHDFTRDPIRLIQEGDWVRADGTTLGADNGVALALAAAVAERTHTPRPPLELLFTVDEETGLTGVKGLQAGWLAGRTLINLDSESEGVFTVGCAGGRDVTIRRAPVRAAAPAGEAIVRLTVGGLCGGHSGIDIHRHRANALKLLARTLAGMRSPGEGRLMALSGGTRRNAIPRDAVARLACPAAGIETLRRQAQAAEALFRAEFPAETTLFLSIEEEPSAAGPLDALSAGESAAVIHLLLALPHGVAQLSPDFEGLVHTSGNLAMAAVSAESLRIVTSQRSLTRSALDAASESVRAVAALAGARWETESEYPPWTPDLSSPLLDRCRRVYRECTRTEPRVSALHAGLECAIIGSIYPDMEMISFGPTTENAHSPSERLHVPSFCRLQGFLVALLASLAAA
jgi:dipeptidase D